MLYSVTAEGEGYLKPHRQLVVRLAVLHACLSKEVILKFNTNLERMCVTSTIRHGATR